MRLDALFRLAFATAPPHGLTLPHTITRRLILQKARGHFTSARRPTALPRLVGARFQVLFHDPSPGHFSPFPHGTGSLSVTREYLGLGGGPPRFTRDFSGPVLLGIPPGSRLSFAYGGVTLCADAFQTSSATRTIFYFLPDQQLWLGGPTTPVTQRLLAVTRDRFGLFPFRSPLLRESLLLSLPVGTEMFHFPTFPPLALCVQARVTGLAYSRVSLFGNPRITVWLSTPRGLSQIPTSFFGSWCQGIHRVPLETWLQILRCSRPLCSSQHTGGPLPASGAYAAYGLVIPAGMRRGSSTRKGPSPAYRPRRCRAHRPSLQDPTTCQALPPAAAFHSPVSSEGRGCTCCAS